MKVLIVSHYFPPHVGGIEVVAQNQAIELVKLGNDVSVITSAIDAPRGTQRTSDNYIIERIAASNIFESRLSVPFPIFSPKLLIATYKAVKNTDIVHVHDAFYLSSLTATFWAWVLRKPVVLSQHVALIPHPKKIVGLIQRLVYKTTGHFIFHKSYKIITFNSRVEQFLLDHRVEKKKLVTIPNGTNLELFKPATTVQKKRLRSKYHLPAKKPLVLFVGRLVPKKGFDKLVKMGSDEYQIVFVGGKAPKGLQSNPQFIFLDSLSQKNLAEVYQACDMFVLPSEAEGFPLSIQEAMASGLPIITTDDDGYSAYRFDRKFFYLIKPKVSKIRESIQRLTDDLKLREEMSAYSLTYARKYFDWEINVTKIQSIYMEASR